MNTKKLYQNNQPTPKSTTPKTDNSSTLAKTRNLIKDPGDAIMKWNINSLHFADYYYYLDCLLGPMTAKVYTSKT
jgi:hypothetical protein